MAPEKKKQPSLYARKTLQKLSSLNSNASLESRQTLAAWIIFNRKKCEGLGEGFLAAVNESNGNGSGNGSSSTVGGEKEVVARLILLLRIIHQVFLSNCPSISTSESEPADADKWTKSSPLRIRLGEIALLPLFQSLASSLSKLEVDDDATMRDLYEEEVKEMMDEWRECNVFGGPTVWEEYRRGWKEALRVNIMEVTETEDFASASSVGDAAAAADMDVDVDVGEKKGGAEGASAGAPVQAEIATTTLAAPAAEKIDSTAKHPTEMEIGDENSQSNDATEVTSNKAATAENDQSVENDNQQQQQTITTTATKSDAVNETAPSSGNSADESGKAEEEGADESSGTPRRASKRDSVGSVDVVVDFEEVEASKVEPTQFLDACKVIASIQITRDLGSDAAMNVSTALSKFPSEVEEACNTILEKQPIEGEEEEEKKTITEVLSENAEESLSKISDEVLDLDIKYARQSLQNYKEAIRQQRKARLQCLQLLLASRCEFGSMDAAMAFCGDGNGDNYGGNNDGDESKKNMDMDTVLQKLKKRKEILVDAMALEGLDVEENDDEEKRVEKEAGEGLRILDWFPGHQQNQEEAAGATLEGEEPAMKKLKT